MKFSLNTPHPKIGSRSPATKRLIVFTRYPEAGKTKTRLIPSLGERGAADLQRRMTEFILSRLSGLNNRDGMAIEIRFEGGSTDVMREWLGDGYRYAPQANGELDQRMGCAFEAAFNAGSESAVIVGSDIPGITGRIVLQAFAALEDSDLVLGPANDGGYYLIGLNRSAFARAIPEVMTGISWGGSDVLQKTLQTADRIGLRSRLLDRLQDIDRPEDVSVWEKLSGAAFEAGGLERISIIIPTLNEARNLVATLDRVMRGRNIEALVVDGGSRDETPEIAQSFGVRVLHTPPSRAGQMNAGARAATGSLLLFLHADTLLPETYDVHVRRILRMPGVAAGAFELRIDSASPSLRIMETVANLRSRYLKRPYGDQAYFMTAATFENVGGFPRLPIMEDYELIRRLSRLGRIAIVPEPVYTSARRWLYFGVWKTWLVNQMLIGAYHLGVSPSKIVRWYRREKGVGRVQRDE